MKKKWKRGLCACLSLLLLAVQPCTFSFSNTGFAGLSYGAERPASVTATTLNVRSAPGTGNSIVGKLPYGSPVTVVGEANAADGSLWYQIRFTQTTGAAATGYVMGTYVKFSSGTSGVPGSSASSGTSNYVSDANFEAYLNSQGFPESYRPGLRELHARYPQWIFTAFDTGLDWNEVIQNESLVGRNLVSSSRPSSWKSTAPGAYDWKTSTWPGFDGSSWVAASEEIIRYYMDPRNFLNETYIFQFLLQDYDASVHTREGLASMVKGTFLEGNGSVGGAYQGISTGTSGSSQPSGTGTSGTTGTNTGNSAATGPGETSSGNNSSGNNTPGSGSSGNASVEIGFGPGYSQGAVSGGQNPSGTQDGTGTPDGAGAASGTNGSGDFSNVWIGVSPGANISKREEQPSISRRRVDTVAETVERVGPGENAGANGSASPGAGTGISPGTGAGTGASPGTGTASGANQMSGTMVGPGGNSGSGIVESSGTSSQGGQAAQGSSGNTKFSGTSAPYVDILIEAGIQSGVSPYVLTAMILQEQGRDGKSDSISGKSGFYNFYNFEAYASNGMTAVQRGLWYASQSGSYMRPWSSADKAIIGGAIQYGQNYMKAGQNTFYLKKFNVQGSNLYKHQYMTNVEGAASEGAKMGDAYSETMRQTAMRFSIPVYRNMPDTACAQPAGSGSPNNKLQSLAVNSYALIPAFSQDTLVYDVTVGSADTSVVIYASAADSTAVISGTGTIALNSAVTEAKVSVTAQNGTVRQYRLRITRGTGNTAGNTGTSGSGATVQGSGSTPTAGSGTGPGGSNVTIVP